MQKKFLKNKIIFITAKIKNYLAVFLKTEKVNSLSFD
jgi:hypothetical protein